MDPLGAFLYTTLSQIAGNERVYPSVLPDDRPTMPAITWSIVPAGRSRLTTNSDAHSGGGTPSASVFRMARVQISCWAYTPEEANALGDLIALELDGLRGTINGLAVGSSLVDTEFDDYEEDTKLFRRLLNDMIQYSVPTGS